MKRADMFESYTLTYWNQIEEGHMAYALVVIRFEKGTETMETMELYLLLFLFWF